MNQVGECLTWMKEWSRDLVTWYDYVKPMQILKKCANNFSCWDKILGRRPGGQVLRDDMNKRRLGRMGVTLQSLKIYGYINSKIKNYQIQRGFFLLFIFLPSRPWPLGCMLVKGGSTYTRSRARPLGCSAWLDKIV